MNTHTDQASENKSQAVANNLPKMNSSGESTLQFVDNRPEAVAQRKLQEAINSSPQVKQLRDYEEMVNNSPHIQQRRTYQVMADSYTSQTIQQKESLEAETLQGKFKPIQKKENNTGLPDNLKSGIENLSGFSMDDVKVHFNSAKPAQLQAHAYAQGTDIHLASGQEQYLPHEAWHVVQQKQGRVKPTLQMKGNVNINDETGLEKEADDMGAQALQGFSNNLSSKNEPLQTYTSFPASFRNNVVQRLVYQIGDDKATNTNAQNIKKRNEIIQRPQNELGFFSGLFKTGILSDLGKEEELKIVGHGDGKGHVSGFTPEKLLLHLMEKGFNAKKHQGPVNLISCLSILRDELGNNFADTFCFWLRLNSFKNQVIGYNGNVHVEPDSTIQIIPPESLVYYDQLAKNRLALGKELKILEDRERTKSDEIEKLMPVQSLDDLLAGKPISEVPKKEKEALANAETELQEINRAIQQTIDFMNELNREMSSLFVPVNNLREFAIPRIIKKINGEHMIYTNGNVERYSVRKKQEVADLERKNFIKKLALQDPHFQGVKGVEGGAYERANPETPSYIG